MDTQNAARFKTLTTARLFLRGLALTDSPLMAALRSDDQVNKYLNRPPCLGLADAEAFIKKIQAGVANNGWYYWAIDPKDEPGLAGTVCLWNADRENSVIEIGYELFPSNQGKGVMFEAAEKVIDFAFNELKFKKIVAVTHRLNNSSIRLLERFGFTEDKSFAGDAGQSADEVRFELACSAWLRY